MKRRQDEREQVRAWARGAREAGDKIAAETARRLAAETPAESFKAVLDLFALGARMGTACDPSEGDDLALKVRIGRQMAKLPRG